jgi:hypothetical protein
VVWADGVTDFRGQVEARGGAGGGDGGAVEISGKRALGFSGTVDVAAPQGRTGFVLFDPVNAIIQALGGALDSQTGLLAFGDFSGEDRILGVDSLKGVLDNGANVTIQANNDIFVNAALVVSNDDGRGGNLTLEAGRSVLINESITTDDGDLTVAANVNLILRAQEDPASGANDAQRQNGPGHISMLQSIDDAPIIDAGTGSVSFTVANGREAGEVRFGNVNAQVFNISNGGGDAASVDVTQWSGTSTSVNELNVSTGGAVFSIDGDINTFFFSTDAETVVSAGALLDVTGEAFIESLQLAGDLFIGGNAVIDRLVMNGGRWEQIGNLGLLDITDFEFVSGTFLRVAGGSGDALDPWQITDVYGLQGMASSELLDDHFVLANNIDASGTAVWTDGNIVRGFRSIGSQASAFQGQLDGNGHSISGLHIDRPGAINIGLFGVLGSSGDVANLTLDGGFIRGGSNVGLLAGQSFGDISNVHGRNADVGGDDAVGGLIGRQTQGFMSGSSFSGFVRGRENIGGLVGFRDGGVSDSFYDYETGVTFEIELGSGVERRLVTQGAVNSAQFSDWQLNGFLDVANYLAFDAVSDAWLIQSAEDFQELLGFADNNLNLLLTGNIDLTAHEGLFIPNFSGSFDGGGFTVSSLRVDQAFNSDIGLFGRNSGDIRNLDVNTLGSGVLGDSNVGIAVGLNSGRIDNVHTEGLVEGRSFVGGLAGQMVGSTLVVRIDRSSSNATVVGFSAVGGLVGTSGSSIRDSHATGVVNATGDDVGGLLGATFGSGAVYERNFATGAVAGRSNVGGLIGRLEADSTLRDSYATGSATATGERAGGLVGSSVGTIETSYSTGSVAAASAAGGLVGELEGAAVVSDSYWDIGASGQAASAGGTGLTSAEMRQQASYAGFDFTGGPVWQIEEGVSSPTLTGNAPVTGLLDFSFSNAGGDLLWSNPLNWNNSVLPTANSRVNLGDGFFIILDTGSYSLAELLSFGSSLSILGNASLTVAGNTTFSGGGDITLGGNAVVNLQGPASFDVFRIQDSAVFSQIGSALAGGVLPGFNANDFQFAGGDFIRVAGGDGSSGNPWQVADVYGLQGMAAAGRLNDFIIQAGDIDAGGTVNWNGGLGFKPIGDLNNEFIGQYDGNGFAISNLFINRPTSSYIGLFGRLGDGSVLTDVHVANPNFTGDSLVGGLAGENFRGSVFNSQVSGGSLAGSSNVGGLFGANFANSSQDILNSHYQARGAGATQFFIAGGGAQELLTIGGLYEAQYLDWSANGRSLDISNYLSFDSESGRYLISSVQDLQDLLGFIDDTGVRFRQTADIDLANDAGFFLPRFSAAQYDGAGFSISNLNVQQSFNQSIGFIGQLAAAATISDIVLRDFAVSGSRSVGGLVGHNNFGFITNSRVENGTVAGVTQVGGVVGENLGGTPASRLSGNMTVNVQVSGISAVGGLAGSSFSDLIADNQVVGGSVSGNSAVGGIVGDLVLGSVVNSHYQVDGAGATQFFIGGSAVAQNLLTIGGLYQTQYQDWSTNFRTLDVANYLVQNSDTGEFLVNSVEDLRNLLGFIDDTALSFAQTADIDLANDAGLYLPLFTAANYNGNGFRITNMNVQLPSNDKIGFIGQLGIGSAVERVHLVNAQVVGQQDVGGLVGRNLLGTVTDSLVDGGSVSGSRNVGGLVGENRGDVASSLSTAAVSGGINTGGLVGSAPIGTISSSYWHIEASGRATSAGGTGLSSSADTDGDNVVDTLDADSYAGFDFADVWGIEEGVTAPSLGNPGLIAATICPGLICFDNDGGDFLWFNPLNWVNDMLPGSGDTVLLSGSILNNLGFATPTDGFVVNFAAPGISTIQTLLNDITLQVSSGTLLVDGSLGSASGSIIVNGGNLETTTGTLVDIGNLTVSNGSASFGDGASIDLLKLSGGTVSAAGLLAVNTLLQTAGVLDIASVSSQLHLTGTGSVVSGGAWTGDGSASVQGGGDIRIVGTLGSDIDISVESGGALRVENGTLVMTGGHHISNRGRVDISGTGVIRLPDDGAGYASFTNEQGGTLAITKAADWAFLSDPTNQGAPVTNAGIMNINAPAGVPGAASLEAAFTQTTTGVLNLANNTTLSVQRAETIAGSVNLGSNANLVISEPRGVRTFQSTQIAGDNSGNLTLNADSTFRNVVVQGVNVNNNAALVLEETLVNNGTLTNNNVLTMGAGGNPLTITGTGSIVNANAQSSINTLALVNHASNLVLQAGVLALGAGGNFDNSGTVTILGATDFIAGNIVGTGGLFRNLADGTLDIRSGGLLSAGVNTFPANDGSLVVNGELRLFGRTFTNRSTGRISGTGIIRVNSEGPGTLINSGTIAPGNSPGTLTIVANFEQTASGILDFEVGGSAPGTFDVLNLACSTCSASFAGTLNITQITLPGVPPPSPGTGFGFFTGPGTSNVSGALTVVAPPTLPGFPTSFTPGSDPIIFSGEAVDGLELLQVSDSEDFAEVSTDAVLGNLNASDDGSLENGLDGEDDDKVVDLGLVEDEEGEDLEDSVEEEETLSEDAEGAALLKLKRNRKICN